MRDWIVIAAAYIVVLGFFRWLGGFASAGDAFRRWGRANSSFRVRPGSSS
jgi:hypothetical protein